MTNTHSINKSGINHHKMINLFYVYVLVISDKNIFKHVPLKLVLCTETGCLSRKSSKRRDPTNHTKYISTVINSN